jgi:hypothetical protein
MRWTGASYAPHEAASFSWSCCLIYHKLAACRTKLLREPRVGNHGDQWRRTYCHMGFSASMPQNSPTVSMVNTSLSDRRGANPRQQFPLITCESYVTMASDSALNILTSRVGLWQRLPRSAIPGELMANQPLW